MRAMKSSRLVVGCTLFAYKVCIALSAVFTKGCRNQYPLFRSVENSSNELRGPPDAAAVVSTLAIQTYQEGVARDRCSDSQSTPMASSSPTHLCTSMRLQTCWNNAEDCLALTLAISLEPPSPGGRRVLAQPSSSEASNNLWVEMLLRDFGSRLLLGTKHIKYASRHSA